MNVSKLLSQVVIFGAALALTNAGCGGQQPPGGAVQSGEGGTGGEPSLQIAGPATPTGPSSRYEGPPHLFTPRPHTPKMRYGSPPTPNISAFPKLKMRMGRCFGIAKAPPAAIATSPVKRVKRKPRTASPKSSRPRKGGAKQRKKSAVSKPSGRGASMGADPFSSFDAAPAKDEKKAAEVAAPEPAPSAPLGAAEEAEAEEMQVADDDLGALPSSQTEADPDAAYNDWGAAIYLSNDDTMSLSSAQRVLFAIDNFLPLPAAHIRPHELLNYFSFNTQQVAKGYDFSVLGDIETDQREPGIYTLALAVNGRPVDRASRRNAALTIVVDRSGSMSDEGRMTYLKQGLRRMLRELKAGDMLHIVLFDHEVCVPAENFVVGRDDIRQIEKVIDAIEPRGSTDLHAGLSEGYRIADQSYRDKFSNRVVMITDALTNTGVTDEQMISIISKYYDSRRIRLSGIGVGRDFNDSLLDKLTEKGKGAYVFLGSEAEVNAVFGSRLVSLIETTALDVHFRLHLPPSLRMNVFYGEESSTVKTDVQEIHYFANTSQLFLSDLMARGGTLRPEDGIMLTIEYKDPETEAPLVEEMAFRLEDLMQNPYNVRKARVIMAFIDMLAVMASRPAPVSYGSGQGTWQDEEGWGRCEAGKAELARLSESISSDPEITRVNQLFEKYCARFERPRNPVRRQVVPPEQGWPGAAPTSVR